MRRNYKSTESFRVVRMAGVWEHAAPDGTPLLHRQERDATGIVRVRVSRVQTRDRDGRKLEKVSQVITGDSQGAIEDYVSTFPPVRSLRVATCVRYATPAERADGSPVVIPCGMRVDSEF